jgi:predicted membrane-bound mannosyltransferase/DNA-binding beta-propeller fold protein YncE
MQVTKTEKQAERESWLDRPLLSAFVLRWETAIFLIILIVAVFTRFYMLEPRVMSHDETSHVYFSWLLHQGRGYQHDPITHGPFQFHIVALSYFLFGDNDFSARIPVVLFSIATVAFLWLYRRYLGTAGALIGAALFVISPYMLYYGRYVRNESFVAFAGVVTIWTVLKYFETGRSRYLYYLTAVTVFHYITKETSYIYSAQLLLFLLFYLVYRIIRNNWPDERGREKFIRSLLAGLGVLAGAAVLAVVFSITAGENAGSSYTHPIVIGLGVIALILFIAAAYIVIRGYTIPLLREERSFDLLILQGVLTLPLLTAFPLEFLGWSIPVSAAALQQMTTISMLQMGLMLAFMIVLAVGIGLWWNQRLFLGNAILFYTVFIIFYTTIFTNGAGVFTGLLGGLGYWLAQHEVYRGDQPQYYYAFLQIPIYEYLPALGALLAGGLALARKPLGRLARIGDAREIDSTHDGGQEKEDSYIQQPPVFGLIAFWALTSLFAFSYAGEKMPWLTVHITLPLILLAALSFGYLVDTTNWAYFKARRGILILVLLPVFFAALVATLSSLLGTNPPFQGRELAQLQATTTFFTAIIAAFVSLGVLIWLVKGWAFPQFMRVLSLAFFAFLGLLTARAAFMASYINYDYATEYLVYAHSGPGNKIVLSQLEDLSLRTTDGLAMDIAYDNLTTYPFWWYFRNFTNIRYYGDSPTRDLREYPAILVGDRNYSKIEPIVGQAYHSFEYVRIWWPNEQYRNLTYERILNAFVDREWRAAIFQIWFNRDYTLFGQLINQDMSLPNWQPGERMRLYLRKDIVAQIWEYGTVPVPEEIIADPYDEGHVNLSADRVYGSAGLELGQFNMPRDLAVADDGTLYIADTGNHRIQVVGADGNFVTSWGGFSGDTGAPVPGAFFEPWGIALGPDETVYVTDTWNHRIQKFTTEGEFIASWGSLGQAETPFALWGPRGIAVDNEGQVFVADTGNKRIIIFSPEGEYIAQFGSSGFGPGQFNEPVSVSVAEDGTVYVTDTWNQRVQAFSQNENGDYIPELEWDITGWYGQSLDNKPYLMVDNGSVYVTDPEGYRVIQFDRQGEFIRAWGDAGSTIDRFRLPTGIAIDPDGGVWIADAGNGRMLHFTLP